MTTKDTHIDLLQVAESSNASYHCEGNEWLCIIKEYLIKNNLSEIWVNDNIKQRRDGKVFTCSDHVRGLVYSLLSNQRPWKRIEECMEELDTIFFHFDVAKIKTESPDTFIDAIRRIKCGNRNIACQMYDLPYNIALMEGIEREYGSMDQFVTSAPAWEIVNKISDNHSKFKMRRLGKALAWEYLRNVGIDGAKPDVHLRRFFAGDRMGRGNKILATEDEVYNTVKKLSEDIGMPMAEIDAIVWNFSASGYGEICTSNPKCDICPVERYCLKHRVTIPSFV